MIYKGAGRSGTTGQAVSLMTSSFTCIVFYMVSMADDLSQHLCAGHCCNYEDDDRLVYKVNNEGMSS